MSIATGTGYQGEVKPETAVSLASEASEGGIVEVESISTAPTGAWTVPLGYMPGNEVDVVVLDDMPPTKSEARELSVESLIE